MRGEEIKMKRKFDYWRGYAVGWLQNHRHYLSFQFWRGYFSWR